MKVQETKILQLHLVKIKIDKGSPNHNYFWGSG